jgi:diaminohydroxyphosphoribosylaminopyrimidine deaminase/5-amino-6-(5-phosphoribosylamino)uracil reductase
VSDAVEPIMLAIARTDPAADLRWMSLALAVGRRGRPAPNPHVGAVIVSGGEAVGLGWHERAGGAHAEVVALHAAARRAKDAVLYVTLEPCNHHGRTPPCVDAIVAAGLRRIVVACIDPNPHVVGHGVDRLRDRAIEVDVGVLREQGAVLIAGWVESMGGADGCSAPIRPSQRAATGSAGSRR